MLNQQLQRTRVRRAWAVAIALAIGLPAGMYLNGAAAYASTLTVTTTADLPGTTCGSPCSLRQAIGAANAAGGSNTITFAVTGVFALTTGNELHVSGAPQQNLTIRGDGPAKTVIDGGGTTRVMAIDAGAAVTVSGLTIRNGSADFGGGVLNLGSLSISNSVVTGNHANIAGGGIRNGGASATATLTNTTIAGNRAGVVGGGIANSGGTLTVTGSVISGNASNGTGGGGGIATLGPTVVSRTLVTGNTAVDHGGGIAVGANHTTVSDSVVSNNAVTGTNVGNDGGGITNYATLTVSKTAVTGNRAAHDGGGIANEFGATATVTDSLLSRNSASRGGGLTNEFTSDLSTPSTITLTRSQVVGNRAEVEGGGIFNPSGSVTLNMSAVAGNTPDNCHPQAAWRVAAVELGVSRSGPCRQSRSSGPGRRRRRRRSDRYGASPR